MVGLVDDDRGSLTRIGVGGVGDDDDEELAVNVRVNDTWGRRMS